MAVHYTERAALLNLPASKKLVLMCVADSANQDNRVGFPGMDAIKQWSGLRSNSRVLEVIAELVTAGYLVRHRGGVNGRRAEFIVFPHGCCALHEPLPGYSPHLPGDDLSGSGVPDADNLGIKPQPPVEGPAEGPAWAGPLPSSVPPVVTYGGNSPELGSGDSTPPASPAEVVGASGPDLERPPVRSCRRWPSPHGSCGACASDREALAAWEAAAHRDALDRAWAAAEAERARQVRARADADAAVRGCRLCDAAGRLPSGLPCLHDAKRNPVEGAGGRAAWAETRAVLACRLCDKAGRLPSGEGCAHPGRDGGAALSPPGFTVRPGATRGGDSSSGGHSATVHVGSHRAAYLVEEDLYE